MRVFIGLKEISGYNTSLKQGFDALGVEAIFVNLFGSKFAYDHDPPPNRLIRAAIRATSQRYHTDRQRPDWRLRWTVWLCAEIVLRLALMVWAMTRYDVFIFTGDSSFLFESTDLRVLRLLGKTVICVEHGSDARPPYINGAVMLYPQPKTTADCLRLTRKTKRRVQRIERWASYVVAIRSVGHFFSQPLVDFSHIGLPRSRPRGLVLEADTTSHNAIRIAHAPSRPISKGTPEIEAIMGELRDHGYAIDFIELVNRPNGDVWRELAQCDFVVDQRYNDCFMTAFSVEAAMMGKPTVCGSYALDSLSANFPAEGIPPALICPPSELRSAIERLINEPTFRAQLGQDAQRFVESTWSPASVAQRFVTLAEGRAPADWFFRPQEIDYLFGNGLSETRARALVGDLIAAGGREALLLDDKPALEQKFVDFAARTTPVP